jgi:hypothetical protein
MRYYDVQVRLFNGNIVTVRVTANDHNEASYLAESQTGGKALSAWQQWGTTYDRPR